MYSYEEKPTNNPGKAKFLSKQQQKYFQTTYLTGAPQQNTSDLGIVIVIKNGIVAGGRSPGLLHCPFIPCAVEILAVPGEAEYPHTCKEKTSLSLPLGKIHGGKTKAGCSDIWPVSAHLD